MLRRFLAVLFLALAGVAVIPSGPAWACSCAEPDHTGALVVVGVAERVEKPLIGQDVRVRIRVESVANGSAGKELELTTAADGAACGYGFEEGHRYRIYPNDGATTLCDGNEDLGLVESPAGGPPGALWWAAPGAGAVLVAALLLLRWRRRRDPGAAQ